ncbi:hypothetical protein BDZ45DRAFT_745096 [Acephala macrosclerotiorum]|nr:hypothetical protein BDZ45DRAFT_745096 [Acephala macrosclerotiorum]
MRVLPFLALLVETSLVVASPYERNGIIYGGRPEPKKARHEVRDLAAEASVLDVVASPVPRGKPDPNFDYLSFCCVFNQPTKTITSTSFYPTTLTVTGTTSTITSVTTLTSVIVGRGASTATCPIPAPTMICGQGGWGYATNNIYSGSGIDAIACHELCLGNAACQSFQVETYSSTTTSTCNLYKVDPSGNNTITSPAAPFAFPARDCPDYVPVACTGGVAPSSPVVTVVPRLLVFPPNGAPRHV